MTVKLDELASMALDGASLGALGYNLLMAAALANDDEHTLASRVCVRMALLTTLNEQRVAWVAHVTSWLESRADAARCL